MTTTDAIDPFSPEADRIIAEGVSASERMRAMITTIEQARDTQPERLAQARVDADTARDWALIEEPWHNNVTAIRAHTRDGQPTATTLALPNYIAKELFGVRLAFDMLDAGEDPDLIDDVKSRYFTMVGGDPGMAFLLFAAALDTVASLVVPQMLEDLEQRASNYDARVMVAQARAKAWADRVGNHHSDSGEQ